MPWFRKSVYTVNTIILYFLYLTTKILLYYYCRNFPNGQPDFPNMLILKKGPGHKLAGPGHKLATRVWGMSSQESSKMWVSENTLFFCKS
jgi:hypothetical protein